MAEGYAGTTRRDTEVRLPRPTKVKNKTPNDRQITAEQLLRESKAIQLEEDFKAPRQKITDETEMQEYRLNKRKEFEDLVRRVGRWSLNVWVKYAQWEEAQKDFRRARSVWERALDINYRHIPFWLKYAEMEMRHRFVNHARNIWDRAVTLLPRIDQLWYKYIHMEEMLGNVAGARQVFERWLQWEPDHNGWTAYIKMELRYDEIDRARQIYERYVVCHPTVTAWVKYAKFEMKNGEVAKSRSAYERAVEELGEERGKEELLLKFAEFEEKCKEVERARAIYRYALDNIPKGQVEQVFTKYTAFEKQHGDRDGIEDVIISKKRFQYEEEVQKEPLNYDIWFDYARLEESSGDLDRVREVYERAISNVPPGLEKRFWQRYIYLWINYALFEELEAEDGERAREVYRAALKLIPHRSFTFAKIWILAAQFEIRCKRLDAARKILGMALGMCPKEKLFRTYIDIELQLGNIERCRTLYTKYLEWNPASCTAWSKFAELETSLGETDRARSIFELAIAQSVLDMPELIWKAYIDFEIAEGNREGTRELYERLLERTKHVKVWMSFAKMEASRLSELAEEGEVAAREAAARGVYERAYQCLRNDQPDAKEEAVMLLEAWRAFEQRAAARQEEGGDGAARAVEAVEKRMPKRVKRKRPILTDEGLEAGMEEYFDYIFPEEAGNAPNLKILEAAYRWKKQKMEED